MHYDINGKTINVLECKNCGNQLGFVNVPDLINGNTLVNELELIDRGMKGVCCNCPDYYYKED